MQNNSPSSGITQHLSLMAQHPSPCLLGQVQQSIQLKHFSLKTEKSYIDYIRDFILFHYSGTLKE
ncbi:hypothetical protein H6G00_01145 [Leptolyngbya sp. FACHB-541]|uniref:hypothetical protein n=1 Tax=Leptolyngbya sp. FACHB-541 TaxID=2692810 RepID=UPI001685916C|nr:hypothetical protein [Leptolyngbya sp. FACHB-541]MBD1995235.1 hypothetical protein [Leptolyngbya sp. FACHB-541]